MSKFIEMPREKGGGGLLSETMIDNDNKMATQISRSARLAVAGAAKNEVFACERTTVSQWALQVSSVTIQVRGKSIFLRTKWPVYLSIRRGLDCATFSWRRV